MTPEFWAIISVGVTSVGTGAGVLFGVWRIQAYYETRNEGAHVDLGRKIDKVASNVSQVAEDVAYLRGRQDERDRAAGGPA